MQALRNEEDESYYKVLLKIIPLKYTEWNEKVAVSDY